MMADDQMTLEEFGKKIKAKYPAYGNLPDADIANKVLAKYPQYRSRVKTQPGFRESFGNVMKSAVYPFTPTGFKQGFQELLHPIETVKNRMASEAEENKRTVELAKGGHPIVATAHEIDPTIGAGAEQIQQGNVAGGLGTLAGIATVYATPEIAARGLNAAGVLRNKVGRGLQKGAQFVTKSSAEYTTKPIVEKYLGDTAEYKQKAGEVIKTKIENARDVSRREGIERSIQEGSERLGEKIPEEYKKIRDQENSLYAPVHQATAGDPGVPATDLIQAVRQAENQDIAGSAESIKQFREILSRESEGEQIMGGDVDPHATEYRNIMQFLEQQGVSAEPASITFKDLKGYSSEIGNALSTREDLPGDVKRALWRVKKALDEAKQTVAERNGVGPQLKQADAFHSKQMDIFRDRHAAVGDVMRTGKEGQTDPTATVKPLVSGKGAETGRSKLKGFHEAANKTGLTKTASLAENLSSAEEQAKTLPQKPAEVTMPKRPAEPTTEEIMGAKTKRISEKSSELGGLRRYDLMVLLAPLLKMPNIEGLAIGAGAIGLEKAAAASLKSPKIMNWITRATEADIKALEGLPEPTKTQLRNNLSAIMRQPYAPKQISPAIKNFLGLGAVAAIPKNRKEAKERLQAVK